MLGSKSNIYLKAVDHMRKFKNKHVKKIIIIIKKTEWHGVLAMDGYK